MTLISALRVANDIPRASMRHNNMMTFNQQWHYRDVAIWQAIFQCNVAGA